MKMNEKLIPRLLFSATLLICSGTFALAQKTSKDDYPKVEVFIGYAALGENTEDFGLGFANTTGFETSVVRNFTRHIGIKGDFSAHFHNDSGHNAFINCAPTCTTITQDFQAKTRVYNFLAGPEFKARNSTRFTPFAHVLAGVAHTTSNFTITGPPFNFSQHGSDTGFAMALGGGFDIRATKKVSFRGQMDYNPVFIDGGRRNLVRISLGVLFH